MISKLHQLNLHDKIKYIYATVIKFMILSGIVSIIGLSLLDIRFNSYVKGAQKANNAAKESIIDISSALYKLSKPVNLNWRCSNPLRWQG